jgi:hypothetical protein
MKTNCGASSKKMVFSCLAVWVLSGFCVGAESGTPKTYVGSEACGECHTDQYDTFLANAKKAHSYDSVMVMKKGLTDQELQTCFACHTTGYGQPGGFSSLKETPHLKNPGCEVCHGPGSLHVESEDPSDIQGAVSIERCQQCHTGDRMKVFKFKPILHAGAH